MLLLIAVHTTAQVIVDKISEYPRDFAYIIGDKIQSRLILTLGSGYTIKASSLPPAGRFNQWLELAAPIVTQQITGDNTEFTLTFNYQIVNVPPHEQRLIIPQINFLVTDGTHEQSAFTDQWSFTVAPITALMRNDGSFPDPQPNYSPVLIDDSAHRQRFWWSLILLMPLMAYLIGHRWLRFFISRFQLPFARAFRKLRRLEHPQQTSELEHALRLFHDAINATAGTTILREDLGEFFDKHPQFRSHTENIEQQFRLSQALFFEHHALANNVAQHIAELCSLCDVMRKIEYARS